MCDYSLHLVNSRPAKVGDQLVVTKFAKAITRGFVAAGEPNVAVCLRPGTEVALLLNGSLSRSTVSFPASTTKRERRYSVLGRKC